MAEFYSNLPPKDQDNLEKTIEKLSKNYEKTMRKLFNNYEKTIQ